MGTLATPLKSTETILIKTEGAKKGEEKKQISPPQPLPRLTLARITNAVRAGDGGVPTLPHCSEAPWALACCY